MNEGIIEPEAWTLEIPTQDPVYSKLIWTPIPAKVRRRLAFTVRDVLVVRNTSTLDCYLSFYPANRPELPIVYAHTTAMPERFYSDFSPVNLFFDGEQTYLHVKADRAGLVCAVVRPNLFSPPSDNEQADIDAILEASDEQILAWCAETLGDPEQIATQCVQLLDDAIARIEHTRDLLALHVPGDGILSVVEACDDERGFGRVPRKDIIERFRRKRHGWPWPKG